MSRTVLIVEEHLDARLDLAMACEAVGFEARACATVGAARQAMREGRVDAVVLDARLPGNAQDLLAEIRATPACAAVPVVVIAAGDCDLSPMRDLDVDAHAGLPEPREIAARVARLAGGPRPPGGSTILVIDDSPTYRLLLRDALEEAGYGVIEAGTGEEGLALAGSRRPDALVVDGVLPGLHGADVIRHLRLDAALRDVPCLLLTAREDREAELQALEAGADAFVRKHDDFAYLLARVGAMLRRSPSRPRTLEDTRSLSGLRRVLFVDGTGRAVPWLSASLEADGYAVVQVMSGDDALDVVVAQPVDCVLVDIADDVAAAAVTCARIKAVPAFREIPIVLLTATNDPRAMLEALGAGADDCLCTASEPALVRARIRALIRRKQFEDENRRIREALLRRELEAVEARAAQDLAETRARLVDELQRKNRELEAFSYSVSHDLRAPLRAIDGFSRVVLEDFGDRLGPDGTEAVHRVRAAARRMGGLIDALLELSRVGRADLRRERVDLGAIARDVLAELRRGSDRRATIIVSGNLEFDADPRLIRIALENLLRNSWKFTAAVPEARIEVRAEVDPERGRLCLVRDNGAGFDPAHAGRLFRPFQRLHAESDYPGTGIGLATVYRIVDRHGGRLWAEGQVGAGAAFRFTLPAGSAGEC
jgi:two-component system, NtrC family, sensor kinase